MIDGYESPCPADDGSVVFCQEAWSLLQKGATGMETIPVFVGLDYHPGSVQVAVLDAAGRVLGNRNCPNDPAAIQRVAESYGVVRRAAIEACTGAADLAERLVAA